jgi:hypothetical protein
MHLSSRDHGRPAAGRAIAIAWKRSSPPAPTNACRVRGASAILDRRLAIACARNRSPAGQPARSIPADGDGGTRATPRRASPPPHNASRSRAAAGPAAPGAAARAQARRGGSGGIRATSGLCRRGPEVATVSGVGRAGVGITDRAAPPGPGGRSRPANASLGELGPPAARHISGSPGQRPCPAALPKPR